jgi:GNAT superfamily N-acetyltransferase
VLGAWLEPGGELVGLAACFRGAGTKSRHIATVGGMYVAPEARGLGIGARLLDAVIARAAAWTGVEQLQLSVVTGNAPARRLYVARGFQSYGVAPRAFLHHGRYSDVEYFWRPVAPAR